MAVKKERIPKESLQELYQIQRRTKSEIAREYGTTKRFITRCLGEYGITKNSPPRISKLKKCPICDRMFESKVRQKYCSSKCMGKDPNKKGTFRPNQRAWNKGIPLSSETRKRLSESHKGKIAPNRGRVKSGRVPTKEELVRDYVEEKLSREIIRKKYGVSGQALTTALKTHNIPLRGWSEARRIALEKGRAVSWNKGLSPEKDERVARMVRRLNEIHMTKIDEARKKQSITRKRLHASGKLKIWNRGKNKMMDSRVMKSTEALRKSRIGKDPWNKIPQPPAGELYYLYHNKGYSLEDMAKVFRTNTSTVMRWLKKEGIVRRRSLYGRKERISCNDGHRVRSSYERKVCNWFTAKGITHEYEPKINYHKYDGNIRVKVPHFIPDFSVRARDGKIYYIEVWGLQRRTEYNKKIERKRRFYQELQRLGCVLIELYPRDNLNEKLGFLQDLIKRKEAPSER